MITRFALLASVLAVSGGSAWAQAPSSSPASFLVVHGIPGRDVGPGIDPLLPVDVLIDGKYCLLQNFTFGSIAGPYDVPAGTYQVAISLANPIAPCSNAAVISASVDLAAGSFSSVVAALSTAGKPTADVFPTDVTPLTAGEQRIQLAHAADAPVVKVVATSTDTAKETLKFDVVPGKVNGSFVFSKPGFTVTAQALSGGPVIGPVTTALGDRSVLEVYAVGSAASGSATLLYKVIPFVR